MILALQTGIELRRFGQSTLIGNITALSMCREMGPFITAVILAATVGSSMAAEIGTMKVSDEVTALEGDVGRPDQLPRDAATDCVGEVMCPALTIVADLVGIWGGSIVAEANLGVDSTLYWNNVRDALITENHFLPKDVYVGIFKSVRVCVSPSRR